MLGIAALLLKWKECTADMAMTIRRIILEIELFIFLVVSGNI